MSGLVTTRSARLLVASLTLSALAACGGASDEESAATTTTTTTVTISSFTFTPAEVTVSAGDTVSWTNEDAIDHTVTSGIPKDQGVPGVSKGKDAKPDGVFDESLPEKGAEATFTFEEAGEFTYYCDIHAGMSGTIIVR